MENVKLPTWLQCSKKIDKGIKLTELEKYVYDFEVVAAIGRASRRQLQKAINELIKI